jgi:rhodanese-related sulfurtransferase
VTHRRALVVVLAVAWLLLASRAAGDHGWAPVLTIDAESAKSLIDRGERVEPVDLRSAAEFRAGRLPRARSVPITELRDRVAEVPLLGVVVLYCGCRRDELLSAYQFLRGRRYTNVYVLEGGIDAWLSYGYPLER